jgi:HPt (histidine-containing phosphotransfer) domain-containing protein
VTDDAGRPARPPRALPAEAVAELQAAFAGEVAVRLPRLLADPLGADALRDAHTLGSSAVVVGRPDASRAARRLEAELSRPRPDPDRARQLVRELADQLSGTPAP